MKKRQSLQFVFSNKKNAKNVCNKKNAMYICNKTIAMKGVVGAPARKEQFYPRPDLRAAILESIAAGEHILLTAPRRVGKTSVLFDLVDNPDDNIYAVYLNTEAINDPEVFYKDILAAIINTDLVERFGKFSHNVKSFITDWAKKISSVQLGTVEMRLEGHAATSSFNSLVKFLTDIKTEGKIILVMLDEFPFTLEHIAEKYGDEAVLYFLNQNRVLRQTPQFSDKVRFVYTGSIGLYSVVKRLNGTDRVNDLNEIRPRPLKKEEAAELFNRLLRAKTGQAANEETTSYVLSKISWLIPFYIQLMVKEMASMVRHEDCPIDLPTADIAFERVVANGDIYFQHYKSRLNKSFRNEQERALALELLSAVKKKERLVKNEAYNMAAHTKYKLTERLDEIIEVLKHDGYLAEESNTYFFYSPILKYWWK